ncbi:DMT family transporter [Sulfuracidifex tepidarius]|uniref:DMT family transporter n=1 Tax=Sulfuracidifex tepidarius TaxID=1294262 RepID=UPI0006D05668|nr:DMT family transporter [Sulfuracidifex tepidarius]
MERKFYYLLLILGGISFGTASIFIKESGMTPASITFLRFLVAGAMLTRGKLRLELRARDYLVLGGLLAFHMFTFIEGVYHTTIMDATVLVSTSPFFVVIFTALRKNVVLRDVEAVLIGFIGVVLINFPLNEGNLVGNLISLISALSIALYTFRLSSVKYEDPLSLTAWIYLFSSLLSFPFFLLQGLGRVDLTSVLSLIGLIAIPTLIGHTSIVISSGKVKPQHIETIGLLEPVVATTLSIPLFGEIPSVLQLGGSALVILSILFIIKGG